MQSGSTTDVSEVIVGRATIELLTDDGHFQGLGSVTINGVVVRSAAVPLRPDISTPDGIRYDAFRLDNIVKDGDDVVLETSAFGTQGLYGEYRDEYDSQQAWPRVVTEPIVDRLDWRLRPEHLELDGVQYDGFSYALRFRSDSRAIHQVTMITTWELGGAAEGNTILSQGQVNPPVYRCEKNTSFTRPAPFADLRARHRGWHRPVLPTRRRTPSSGRRTRLTRASRRQSAPPATRLCSRSVR